MRRSGSRLGWLRSALLVVLALPAEARAHAAMQGVNHFMSGVLHPLMTPAHVLILLGLSLALGQQVPLKLRLPLLVFPPLLALALALTMGLTFTVPQPVLIVVALCAGAVVALGRQLPPFGTVTLFAAGALAMGLDSGVETGGIGSVIQTLLGTWIGLVVFLLSLAYYASLAAEQKRKWLHIGLRVMGSWIVAISLLMLAFALRK